MARADTFSLDDRYLQTGGEIYLSGMQALVRLLLEQSRRDRAAGRRTAGFVSGYRGSPIGGFDRELWRARQLLDAHAVRFEPGLNEELAATACWGTQQVQLFPQPRCAGVFALWYAKSPGLDRATDAIKHASHAGTAPSGGVLAVVGDDHLAKSSAFGHQSEYAFIDCLMPVLAPGDIGEILELGLLGWALSRYCGAWVGFKLAGSICEASASVQLPQRWPDFPLPRDVTFPSDGVHIRWPDDPLAMEQRAKTVRLPAAQAFVRAAGVDRCSGARGPARLGIVAPGRAHAQVRQALAELGIGERELAAQGVRVYKPALLWPLEPQRLLEFAAGLETLLVVEDKRPLVEDQIKVLLYDRAGGHGPRVIGKRDERGAPLLPEAGEVDALAVAIEIGRRLAVPHERLVELERRSAPAPQPLTVRTPYFCSGCPHNTSTRIPEDSIAIGGIGCHTLAMGMDRGMLTFAHMGGEGATWIGIAPFTGLPHVFQNMGDGTYQHSGLLGIRAAVAAGVTVTFKILYNDAVAMTGGQPVEGRPTVPQITRQLAAERVRAIAVVSDEPGKYTADDPLAEGVSVHHRDELEAVQRWLQATPGVTALVYDQTCAAEKRRRRKRGLLADPPRRVLINELVCEGCGDCSRQSNCLSIVPVETDLGRKRQIDQASCNKDFSCLNGFCPSFVTIEGGRLRRPATRVPDAMPAPPLRPITRGRPCRVLLAGIGGTGIVTLSALLGTAARIEGLAVQVNDLTGMAQKGGPVLGHVQIAADAAEVPSEKIPPGTADVLLAVDLVVATMPEAMGRVGTRTRALANTDVVHTGAFTRDPEASIDAPALVQRLQSRCAAVQTLPALQAAAAAVGDPVAAGLLMLGYAVQGGLIPLRLEALEQALRLNGVAVERNLAALGWGRHLAADPAAIAALGVLEPARSGLEERIARRVQYLVAYQDRAYATRYEELLERVRRAESEHAPAQHGLLEAVAESAFRLMAYKDEYEVARLHLDPAFHARIAALFEGDWRLRVHLAPPLLARRDAHTGVPRKHAFGAWIWPAFRLLHRLRRLRGTWLDPFGWSAERRLERALVVEYFALVAELCGGLAPENHSRAVALAAWPQQVRGFGHVKQRSLEQARAAQARLLVEWRSAPGGGLSVPAAAAPSSP